MPHDLDHVAETLLNVLAPVTGGQAGGQRLDGPPKVLQLAALVITLRPEGAPLDDVGVQQIPVTHRPDPRAHIGAGADQALGLENTQGLPHHGAGDLEALADLLRHERPVGSEVTGNNHLAELLDQLAVKPTAPAGRAAPARPPQLGVGPSPGTERGALAGRRLRIGVAVEFARAGEAGVGGAGGGHHGVRKGTHASFFGAARPALEVFAEKHTKG